MGVDVPAAAIAYSLHVPEVATGVGVDVPSGTITYQMHAPTVAATLGVLIDAPAATIAYTLYVPGVVAAGVARLGGGGGAKKHARTARKYPRRVMVDGQTYWVASPQEEQALLALLLSREREQLAEEVQQDAPPARVMAKRKVKIRRIESRLEAAEARVDAWQRQLHEWDEQLIYLM